jgi:general L-amino acid transport system permease protein
MAITMGTAPKPVASSGLMALINRREVRQVIYQVILVLVLGLFFWEIVTNAAENLRRQGIASGFGFFDRTAGFDISQSLIDYSNTSTYGRALLAGVWNTVLIAGIGILFATLLGFAAGIARLSSNWLVARIATVYVEIARNVPLLLQLFLWYFGVLKNLPEPISREGGVAKSTSIDVLGVGYLNVRGLFLPKPEWLPGAGVVLWTLIGALVASLILARWATARQMRTGQRFPVFWTSLAMIILGPLLAFFIMGKPVQFDVPQLGRFNLTGGMVVLPEFVALLLGLVFYTGAYIAEIVRGGILAVPTGQKEAAKALGLSSGQSLRLVVIPQAARVIIPPLTSQFLNLTKNSSLAVAIAYPDFTSVAGTVLNQTGQAVEVVLLMMGLYLALSLVTSLFMNWFNKRMALVER